MPLAANARKSNPPPIRWKAFSLPKRGHTAAEYEDAFAGSSENGRFAVGDSCLFHISKDQLVKTFPVATPEEFGNLPDLLGSRPMSDEVLARRQKLERGKWQAGDRFFLMTDALAHWFLCRHKAAGKPW